MDGIVLAILGLMASAIACLTFPCHRPLTVRSGHLHTEDATTSAVDSVVPLLVRLSTMLHLLILGMRCSLMPFVDEGRCCRALYSFSPTALVAVELGRRRTLGPRRLAT